LTPIPFADRTCEELVAKELSGVGCRKIDGQAREGEKAGRSESMQEKRKEFVETGAEIYPKL
jgi:hypothetical protein